MIRNKILLETRPKKNLFSFSGPFGLCESKLILTVLEIEPAPFATAALSMPLGNKIIHIIPVSFSLP